MAESCIDLSSQLAEFNVITKIIGRSTVWFDFNAYTPGGDFEELNEMTMNLGSVDGPTLYDEKFDGELGAALEAIIIYNVVRYCSYYNHAGELKYVLAQGHLNLENGLLVLTDGTVTVEIHEERDIPVSDLQETFTFHPSKFSTYQREHIMSLVENQKINNLLIEKITI